MSTMNTLTNVGEEKPRCTAVLNDHRCVFYKGHEGDHQWAREKTKYHDPVNHPHHYTSHPSGIECITITRHMGFNLGNAVKYIWRADLKGGAIQDLEKAAWYINDEIQRRRAEINIAEPITEERITGMAERLFPTPEARPAMREVRR